MPSKSGYHTLDAAAEAADKALGKVIKLRGRYYVVPPDSDPFEHLKSEEVKLMPPPEEPMTREQIENMPPKPKKKPKKKMNKGGYSGMSMKKPEMMKGGMYKGKKHMYAAGGLVRDMNIMENK